MPRDDRQALVGQDTGRGTTRYDVICTYEVDADSEAAAREMVDRIAQSTQITRRVGARACATLVGRAIAVSPVQEHPSDG